MQAPSRSLKIAGHTEGCAKKTIVFNFRVAHISASMHQIFKIRIAAKQNTQNLLNVKTSFWRLAVAS